MEGQSTVGRRPNRVRTLGPLAPETPFPITTGLLGPMPGAVVTRLFRFSLSRSIRPSV